MIDFYAKGHRQRTAGGNYRRNPPMFFLFVSFSFARLFDLIIHSCFMEVQKFIIAPDIMLKANNFFNRKGKYVYGRNEKHI